MEGVDRRAGTAPPGRLPLVPVRRGQDRDGADGHAAEGVNRHWMIGFAPANNPQFAVAVVVPFQNINSDGAGMAGPIVNAVMQAALPPGSVSQPCSVQRAPAVDLRRPTGRAHLDGERVPRPVTPTTGTSTARLVHYLRDYADS